MIIQFINQWLQLKGEWNWIDFTVIELSFEKDCRFTGYEMTFIIFGLGFWARLNTIEGKEKMTKLADKINQ